MSEVPPGAPPFALRGAALSYGARTALRPTDLDVRAGELLVIVGPNGAGKSTLLRLLTGEAAPDRGDALSRGQSMRRLAPALLARRRAVLPQSSALAFPFTVAEVVRLGLEAGGRRADATVVAAVLERVELGGFAGRLVNELSGGEQQRAHLARVLAQVGDPVGPEGARALFLDEPVSSLDIRHQLGVLKIAQDFARGGGAAVAVLHDLNLAAAFADRLVAVANGRTASEGAPDAVLTDALMRDVFGVPVRVRALPPPDKPFVLPQA